MRTPMRWATGVVMVAAIVLGAAACGSDDDTSAATTAAPTTAAAAPPEPEVDPPPTTEPAADPVEVSLRLPWFPSTQFAGSYVAAAKGFFADEGLDVTINPGGFDVNSITLVAAGSDTFGLHDTGSLLFAAAEDIPLHTVATYFHKHPGAVMALAESGIETLEDFEGRRIGFVEGGPWQLTQAMLVKNGVDLDSMEQVAIGFDLTPLLEGEIDLQTVFSTNEPILAAMQGREATVFVPYDYGIETSANALFTTQSYFEANPDVVCGMVRAIARGWEYAFDHAEEALDIVMAVDPENLDRAKEARSLDAVRDAVLTPDALSDGIGSMKHSRWEAADEVLRTYGGLEVDVDLDSVYSNACY